VPVWAVGCEVWVVGCGVCRCGVWGVGCGVLGGTFALKVLRRPPSALPILKLVSG
jgi:hypothetical protein